MPWKVGANIKLKKASNWSPKDTKRIITRENRQRWRKGDGERTKGN